MEVIESPRPPRIKVRKVRKPIRLSSDAIAILWIISVVARSMSATIRNRGKHAHCPSRCLVAYWIPSIIDCHIHGSGPTYLTGQPNVIYAEILKLDGKDYQGSNGPACSSTLGAMPI